MIRTCIYKIIIVKTMTFTRNFVLQLKHSNYNIKIRIGESITQ